MRNAVSFRIQHACTVSACIFINASVVCCVLQRELFFFQVALAMKAARDTQAPHSSCRPIFTRPLACGMKKSGTINTTLSRKPHSAALLLSLPSSFLRPINPKIKLISLFIMTFRFSAPNIFSNCLHFYSQQINQGIAFIHFL